jgi:hypothetical protein
MRNFLDRLRDTQEPEQPHVATEVVPMMVERPYPDGRRLFVIDCRHGKTDVIVEDFSRTDPARASGIWTQVIAAHRKSIFDLEHQVCECQPNRPQRLS